MHFSKGRRFHLIVFVSLLVLALLVVGCGKKEEPKTVKEEMLTIAGSTWDSAKVNAEIFAFIAQHGYGYNTDIIMASSMIELQQHAKGDVDVRIENWTKSYGDEYYEPVKSGDLIEVNEILKDNMQGYYVPTIVIKGDKEKGIEPITPDLKSVFDLPKYWEVFKDPEDPKKGRIYGAPETWSTNTILEPKMKNFELEKNFNLFKPGSDVALATAIASAAEKGEPIVAYYWEPTWLLGKYDMTKLEEPPFTEEKWKTFNCDFPADRVTVTIHKHLLETAPDVVEVLKNFEMTSPKMNEILAYMQDNNVEAIDAALWYLKNNKDTWSKWVSKDAAEKVSSTLK